VQPAEGGLEVGAEALEVVGEPPQFGGIDDGLRHGTLLPGAALAAPL
jgi:hypothetical protein